MQELKIFLLLSKYSLKTVLMRPVGVILFILGKFLRFIVFFFFLLILLKKTRVFAGYDMNQALIFFLTFNVIDSAIQLLFREVYRFRQLVISGELDTILVKPYNPFIRVLIGGIDFMDAVILLIYVGLLSFFISKLTIPINYLAFFGLLINALIIGTGFQILILAIGILTTEVDHTIMIYRDITRMAALPIDIYREPIKSIFTFILPVGIMMTYPVKALFNLLNWKLYLLSFTFGFLVLFFGLTMWKMALRKYQSWGG